MDIAPKKTMEKSNATAGLEEDLESLRTKFSKFRNSLQDRPVKFENHKWSYKNSAGSN